MPCASSWSHDEPYPGQDTKHIQQMQRELDLTTRMLCALLRTMDARGELPDDPELREWYDAHRAHDRRQGRA